MSRRWATGLALALAVGLALAALVWATHRSGAPLWPGARTVDLGEVPPAVLDTVSLDGRTVRASMNGLVMGPGPDDTTWIETDEDGFPVDLGTPDSLAVLDRVLVVGRVRSWLGRRWLQAEAWVPVHGEAR